MAKYVSNAKNVKRELYNREEKALNIAGILVNQYVVMNIDLLNIVDTGRLKGSYGYKVDMKRLSVYNGTNVDYAPHHEFGTGKYAEGGVGRVGKWSYQRADGTWVTTSGIKPRPHLRPAYLQHIKEIQKRMQAEFAK